MRFFSYRWFILTRGLRRVGVSPAPTLRLGGFALARPPLAGPRISPVSTNIYILYNNKRRNWEISSNITNLNNNKKLSILGIQNIKFQNFNKNNKILKIVSLLTGNAAA